MKPMSHYTYVATAQPPTQVSHSLTGRFTHKDDLNLIVGKCTRFEVYLMKPDGLEKVEDVPVFGRISFMKLIRPPGSTKDLLFISLERHKYAIMEYDTNSRQLLTLAKGDISDAQQKATEAVHCFLEPSHRMIGVHLHEGVVKMIYLQWKGTLVCKVHKFRLSEVQVLDMCFLAGYASPTIAVLHQDSNQQRYLKTYTVNMPTGGQVYGTLTEGPWKTQVEVNAHTLLPIPQPFGGVIVIDYNTLCYVNGVVRKDLEMSPCDVLATAKVDPNGSRWLLGDRSGRLLVTMLRHNEEQVQSIELESIGRTSCPNTISYLDNGVVFVGSSNGDSQLVKLNAERDADGSYTEILDSYKNIGPIQDMAVVDLDRQGQSQVVTCSGCYSDGSLRVVRNGIGIEEQATIELPGIQGLWSLRESLNDPYDKYLVESFIGDTRILGVSEDGLEEIELEGFQEEQTIYCGNAVHDQLVQVTVSKVVLVNSKTGKRTVEWAPNEQTRINVAHSTPSQIVLGLSGGHLILLNVSEGKLEEVKRTKLDKEIACLDTTPIGDDEFSSTFVVLGLWEDKHLRVLSIPHLAEVTREPFEGDVVPRSVLFAKFENDASYLLCGLGDGNLLSWEINGKTAALSSRKKISVGTQPIRFSRFWSSEQLHVFACSDRPTIVHRSNGKLLFSNVNLEAVNYMAKFDTEFFPDCLAFGLESDLLIGKIDEIQKLHIRDVPLGEQPRRIAHSPKSNAYAVLTLVTNFDPYQETETSHLKLLDDQTFEVLDNFSFDNDEFEQGASMTLLDQKDADAPQLFVVGTAYDAPNLEEPVRGRILVFKVNEKKLQLVTSIEVEGSVYCLTQFGKDGILAGINSKIHLYRYSSDGDSADLRMECGHHGHILVMSLKARGDYVLAADLMRSVSLLMYKPVTSSLVEIARDQDSNWMCDTEMFDDEAFIGVEHSGNMFVVSKNTAAQTNEERQRLEVAGRFHLGTTVNKIRAGSLVMSMPLEASTSSAPALSNGKAEMKDEDEDDDDADMSGGGGPLAEVNHQFTASLKQKFIYGTIDGSIGVVARLSDSQFKFLSRLEDALRKHVSSCGGFSHSEWRKFRNDATEKESVNFIDGDLIEQFPSLSQEKMSAVAGHVGLSVDYISKQVDDLSRIK